MIALSIGFFSSDLLQRAEAQKDRYLCVSDSRYKTEVLRALGSDLRDHFRDDCTVPIPQADKPDFEAGYPSKTGVIERGGLRSEPVFSVTVVVVDAESVAYRLASETGYIVEARYHCRLQNCAPVGYEVYVTPKDLVTDLPDQLVAIAFGTPRDVCSDPTPQWIQDTLCPGGVKTELGAEVEAAEHNHADHVR
jgi:hypothetical protein